MRNGTEGPDLATMGGLWAQYQNAITLGNKQGFPMTGNMEQNVRRNIFPFPFRM